MHLYDLPLIFALVGLALYTVLAGADFGAGLWQLTATGRPGAEPIREHAHRSMGPVWEANHVWLIFVLTVTWTAYPTAFGSIASTLSVPLFVAALGIIFRGAAYALRSGASGPSEVSRIDTVFGVSSILTPFALGAAVGGIASRRVPVGNAAGDLWSSWTGPTSILAGLLAVTTAAYLAAVYLSADAVRLAQPDLARRFRARALGTGVVSGAVALGGLAVLHSDARPLYQGLVQGDGLPALIVSVVAGVCTLVLVWRERFEPARYAAALAVAAIVAGWALAQNPTLLPGLTVQQAASPHDTLVGLVVAVLAGGAILFPSLALLFRLALRGQLHPEPEAAVPSPVPRRALLSASAPGLGGRSAAACLVVGFGLLTVADAGWAHAIGVVALLGFVFVGFFAVAPDQLASQPTLEPRAHRPTSPGAGPTTTSREAE
ncbi:MAG: cytochrome bd ubiquinol oxidase subunit [Thermoleophilaceae bacterium]|jgi:cytochrome d ubiquinol oxidase subunit II|nr:cytochrome bd ubiquinol oxidase subunit [Thermoleophilaceae bacterium]